MSIKRRWMSELLVVMASCVMTPLRLYMIPKEIWVLLPTERGACMLGGKHQLPNPLTNWTFS